MADVLVGSSATREVYLEELGVPIAGATLLYDLASPRAAALLTAAPVLEQGGGWYAVQLTAAQVPIAGRYLGRWYGTAGGSTVARPDPFLAVHPGALMLQRWELRHHVADLCDDHQTVIATAGDSTSFTDPRHPEAHWRGWHAYVYGGPGRGEEQLVMASSSGGVFTTTPWVTAPAAGSYIELHRLKTVSEYNRAINLAILQSGKRALLRVTDESIVGVQGQEEYALPAGLLLVSEVSVQDPGDPSWTRLERPTRGAWEILPGRLLRIPSLDAGQRVRVVGQMLPDTLHSDTSYVDTHPEFLAFKAAAHILGSKIIGQQVDRDAMAQRANYYQEQALRLEPTVRPMRGAVRV